MASPRRHLVLLGALALSAATALFAGCKSDKKPSVDATQPAAAERAEKPTLRLHALGGAAGAIEPCGCVKDMLGGVDHTAAFLAKSGRAVPSFAVAAGPMFLADPHLPPAHREQALLKAETMAQALSDAGLIAWAPGVNDWALGVSEFDRLQKLSGATALAANLPPEAGAVVATQIVEMGGVKVGLAGISLPRWPGGELPFEPLSPAEGLKRALLELKKGGAQIHVALIAAPRGEALRLLERVSGFQVAALGKPFDQGDSNDPAAEPLIVGETLVVQGQNHLQGVAVVDLFVREQSFRFADGSGLTAAEERASLDRRIAQLEARIVEWKAAGVDAEDLKARQGDLSRLRQSRAALQTGAVPQQGSYFTYELVQVRESQGVDDKVGARLLAYYKRVNAENKERFKDRVPEPPSEGQASYVGIDRCSTCHAEARQFWETTQHAKAYETLTSDHKEFNLDCVGCHVTGYEQPGGSTVTHTEGLADVQCEVCHGPGSKHAESPLSEGSIRLTPPLDLCSDCHHSPHVADDWSVATSLPKILGKGHGG